MSNIEKVSEFLTKTQIFYVLTTDGDQPKGRPFGAHFLVDGKIYFSCGTFKNVLNSLLLTPKWRFWRLTVQTFSVMMGLQQ